MKCYYGIVNGVKFINNYVITIYGLVNRINNIINVSTNFFLLFRKCYNNIFHITVYMILIITTIIK